jgi:hypothetical protein
MYGPVMLNFTLAAVLLVLMKTSVHGKQVGVGPGFLVVGSPADLTGTLVPSELLQISTGVEETLMGTALAVSFGYWITFSAMLYTVGFIFNTDLTGLQMLTLTVSMVAIKFSGEPASAVCVCVGGGRGRPNPQPFHVLLPRLCRATVSFRTACALHLGLCSL